MALHVLSAIAHDTGMVRASVLSEDKGVVAPPDSIFEVVDWTPDPLSAERAKRAQARAARKAASPRLLSPDRGENAGRNVAWEEVGEAAEARRQPPRQQGLERNPDTPRRAAEESEKSAASETDQGDRSSSRASSRMRGYSRAKGRGREASPSTSSEEGGESSSATATGRGTTPSRSPAPGQDRSSPELSSASPRSASESPEEASATAARGKSRPSRSSGSETGSKTGSGAKSRPTPSSSSKAGGAKSRPPPSSGSEAEAGAKSRPSPSSGPSSKKGAGAKSRRPRSSDSESGSASGTPSRSGASASTGSARRTTPTKTAAEKGTPAAKASKKRNDVKDSDEEEEEEAPAKEDVEEDVTPKRAKPGKSKTSRSGAGESYGLENLRDYGSRWSLKQLKRRGDEQADDSDLPMDGNKDSDETRTPTPRGANAGSRASPRADRLTQRRVEALRACREREWSASRWSDEDRPCFGSRASPLSPGGSPAERRRDRTRAAGTVRAGDGSRSRAGTTSSVGGRSRAATAVSQRSVRSAGANSALRSPRSWTWQSAGGASDEEADFDEEDLDRDILTFERGSSLSFDDLGFEGGAEDLREGLQELFRAARLPKDLLPVAEAWCAQVGAVTMAEVLEFAHELERALGLKLLEQRRYRAITANRKTEAQRQNRGTVYDDGNQHELLPGLAQLLRDSLLPELLKPTEAWVEEMGVVSLEELIHCVDELEEHLQLKVMDRQRLRKVMATWEAAAAGPAGWAGAPSATAPACTAGSIADGEDPLGLAEIFGEAELLHLIPAAREWCDEMGVRTVEEVANVCDKLERALGLQVMEQRRLRSALTNNVGRHALAVATVDHALPGVSEILSTARLSEHLNAALEWCHGMGASSIEEVGGYLEVLGQHLGLKVMEQRRLQKAYDAFLGVDVQDGAQGNSPDASRRSGVSAGQEESVDACNDTLGGNSAEPKELTLREFLHDARLVERKGPAEAWCVEMGVSLVEDLAALHEEFIGDMNLRPMEVTRFKAALARNFNGVLVSEHAAPLSPLPVQERARSRGGGGGGGASRSTPTTPNTSLIGSPEEAPDGHVDWTVEPSEVVFGLRELLMEARLEPYLDGLQAWCSKAGAVLLEEVAESADEIQEHLGLRVSEVRRFRAAVSAAPRIGAAARADHEARLAMAEQRRREKQAAQERELEQKRREKAAVDEVIANSKREADELRAELEAVRAASEEMKEHFKLAQERDSQKLLKEHKQELAITKFQMSVRHVIAKRKEEEERIAAAKAKAKAKGKKGKKK